MEKIKKAITQLFIDLLMGTLRTSIFSVWIFSVFDFGVIETLLIAFLLSCIIYVVDINFLKLNTTSRFSIPILKKEQTRIFIRLLFAPILGYIALIGTTYLIGKTDLSSLSQAFQYCIYGVFLFYTIIEILYILVKYWLQKKKSANQKNYKTYLALFNDNYLPSSDAEHFIKIINSLEADEAEYNKIRTLLESIFKRLNKKDIGLIPDELFNGHGGPILQHVVSFMSNKENKGRVPDHVAYSMSFIKQTTSAFSHHYEHKYSFHMNQACFMALLECLDYLKMEVDKKG